MGRETLRTGGTILKDITNRSPAGTTTPGDIVSKHVTEFAQNLISNFKGCGSKRAREAARCRRIRVPSLKKSSVSREK